MADSTRLNPTDDEEHIQTSMDVQAEAQKRKKYVYGGIALLLTIILIIVIIVATTSGGGSSGSTSNTWPVVVVTWDKKDAADVAYAEMMASETKYKSLDGVVKGTQWCQTNCNKGPPRGANVDTEGQVTQSAMVIYGPTMDTGAVANLYEIDDAVLVAKYVLIYTDHAMIVGEAATRFAVQNGLTRKNLKNGTNAQSKYNEWIQIYQCNNTFWRNINMTRLQQEGKTNCSLINGTYVGYRDEESSVKDMTGCEGNEQSLDKKHDNLEGGMVTGSVSIIGIDEFGEMSLATSSNGLNNKIAGRVSDAAVPGAGGYIDPLVGGCTATGHGDLIIRFAPSKTAVTFMKSGYSAQEAAQLAIDEIEMWCGPMQAIVLCLSKSGEPGIAQTDGKKPNFAYRSDKCDKAVSANIDNPRGDCV